MSDSDLRARLRLGDPDALSELLAHSWRPLVDYLSPQLGDPDVAQDIAQDAFVRLWQSREFLKEDGSLEAYLFQVARNAARDYFRRGRVRASWSRRQTREQETTGLAIPSPVSHLSPLEASLDDLIQRVLRNEATDDDRRALDRWRGESTENEQRFQEFRRVWELTGPAASRRPAPLAKSIIALADARPRRGHATRWRLLSAAAVLGALSVLTWWQLRQNVAPVEAIIAGDSALTVTLADGSFMRLAPGSAAAYQATASGRTLGLEGTAFFAVAQRDGQPFTVVTGGTRTTVVGTRFVVRRLGDSVRIAVVQGIVSVATSTASVRIEGGEIGIAVGSGLPVRIEAADLSDDFETLPVPPLYQRTPLAQVAAELAERFNRRIVVADSALGVLPVTGRFDGERFEDAVNAMCVIVSARCRLDGSPVRIER